MTGNRHGFSIAGATNAVLGMMIFLFVVSGPARAAQLPPCPSNMTNYWKLDETSTTTESFTDSVGGKTAGCSGSSCPASVSGKVGNARLFDGIDDGLSVAADPSFDWGQNDSFSIELWMKTSGTGSCDGQIFVGRIPATDTGLQWWVGCWGTNSTAAFQLIDTSGYGGNPIQGTKALNDGLWHHIVAVRDKAGQNRLYVDGALEGSANVTYSAGFDSAIAALNIGWLNYPSYPSYFDGTIDEMALYSKALSDVEIRSHYYLARGYCDMCSAPVSIMPLGDSITNGDGEQTDVHYQVGYRQKLYLDLVNSGYYVDFVGSLISGDYASPSFDTDHEGHPGWLADSPGPADADFLAPHVYDFLVNVDIDPLDPPVDVILLHIGTNDIPDYADPNKVGTILNHIDDYSQAYSHDITVLLARIILKEDTPSDAAATVTWNDQVQGIATGRIAQGDKIISVDQQDALSYPADYFDSLHPNQTGYEKMATVWLNTLKTFLPVCYETLPSIYSTPPTSAAVGYPYIYDVQATGIPSPTYSLLTAPSDMIIDPATGHIQWTPSASGAADVSVQAANTMGSSTPQDFVLDVLACPSGLIRYWELDESAAPYKDFFGRGDALCSACPAPAAGIAGSAQQFAADDQVSVAADPSFDWGQNDSFSIELWMKTSGTGSCDGQIFAGRIPATDTGLQWWVGCWTNNTAAFQLIDTTKYGTDFLLQGTKALNDGLWHHIVAVRDGVAGENRLYVDGSLEALKNVTYRAGFDSDTAAITIGWLNYPGYPGLYFNGTIDEIALYGKALTQTEIQQHLTNGAGGKGYCYGYYVVTPSAGANGGISPAVSQTVVYNETKSFVVSPDIGYHIDSVAGCGGALLGNIYTTAPVLADCTVTATFAEGFQTYTVTSSAAGGGSITPAGSQTVTQNSTVAFTVTPDTGYHIDSVTGCGGALLGNIYTTGPIAGSCTVEATFAINGLVKKISGAVSTYYSTLYDACASVSNGDIIQGQAVTFDEDVTFDHGGEITFDGGYDSSFSTSLAGITVVHGTMTISNGTVTLQNIELR